METKEGEYTIQQIDDAIIAILGPNGVRRGDWSWARPTAMLVAASRAWILERPEDEHSKLLRAALKDMDKFGYMKPLGGWPEDEK
jgi:hypothetical protein